MAVTLQLLSHPSRVRPLCQSFLMRPPRPLLYHSHTHPPPTSPFSATESAILSAATEHIPVRGFTTAALALGAKSAGYLDATTNLFPAGAFSLVQWHLHTQRLALSSQASTLPPLDIAAKVRSLTWIRLSGNKPVIHKWQEALALMSIPSNVAPSVRELALLSDEIWFLASDKSVDTSWYTKRFSLAGIYAATELFMTTDTSEGFADTREFLERRFEDSRRIGSVLRDAEQWVGFTARSGVNVLRSKGVKI